MAAIGAGSFLVYKINHGLNYDITSVDNVGTNVEIVSEDIDSVTIKKNDDSAFKVVMFTDTQLNGNKEDQMSVNYIVENVTREKSDLVIFGGDNVSSAISKKRTVEFAQLMEKLGIYRAAVLGNHDGEGVLTYSRKETIDIYATSIKKVNIKGVRKKCRPHFFLAPF